MGPPTPQQYRTTNWKSYPKHYDCAASLLVWLDKEMAWFAAPTGKPGRNERFSDAAIQFCLMIKNLFNPPLRQTTGMIDSLLKLAGLNWPVP